MGALAQALYSIRRSTVKVNFEGYNASAIVPTIAPTQTSRRLRNSELQLYKVKTNENRKLQTICPSVEQCLKKYEFVKIVKVVQEITVPLSMNVDAAEYSILLLNLLSDQDYFGYLRRWAQHYGSAMSYNISTTICGYTSLDQCDTMTPSALPSFNPSALVTASPSTFATSITSSFSPTYAPTAGSIVPTAEPTAPPTDVPSVSPSSSVPSTVTPSSSVPSTVTPSSVPSTATPSSSVPSTVTPSSSVPSIAIGE
jgi:hypothetical protein